MVESAREEKNEREMLTEEVLINHQFRYRSKSFLSQRDLQVSKA